jgi:predicted nucleic acid-binding protein
MIFVDAGAWLALADSHDRDHPEAPGLGRRLARGIFGKQVTANYVMTETITPLRRCLGLSTAVSFAKTIT